MTDQILSCFIYAQLKPAFPSNQVETEDNPLFNLHCRVIVGDTTLLMLHTILWILIN
jgi:hypothetical protein